MENVYSELADALPGYIAGLKQGWSFSWRSLMAAEIIVHVTSLGTGLGQLLDDGRANYDVPLMFLSIILILIVPIVRGMVVTASLFLGRVGHV